MATSVFTRVGVQRVLPCAFRFAQVRPCKLLTVIINRFRGHALGRHRVHRLRLTEQDCHPFACNIDYRSVR